jgi:tape measure domain-containing protein
MPVAPGNPENADRFAVFIDFLMGNIDERMAQRMGERAGRAYSTGYNRGQRAGREGRAAEDQFKDFKREAGRAGQKAKDAFNDAASAAQRLQNELRDVIARLRAVNATVSGLNTVDTPIFGEGFNESIRANLGGLAVAMHEYEQGFDKIMADTSGHLRRTMETRIKGNTSALFAGVESTGSARNFTKAIFREVNIANGQILRQQEIASNERIFQAREAGRHLRQAEKQAGDQRLIAQRGAEQRATAFARESMRRRTLAVQSGLRLIVALERQAAQAVRGIYRTLGTGVRGAFSAASAGISGIIQRHNRELSTGLSSSLTSRESILSRSFSRQTNTIRTEVTKQQRIIEQLRTETSKGVAGAVTGRGIGPGGLALGIGGGIGLGALLTQGFERFSNLQRINKQFEALIGNQEQAAALLEQVKEFAKTTPFDLVGVADLAKGFLAIGTASEDVIPRVRAIADAVALTGGGVPELERIQRAIGQVVATGRLQGDELNQLAENLPGLNIRQILADQLTGGNVQALVRMQEAGDLSGQAFVDGLIAGLQGDPRLIGASDDLAKTLAGRTANLKESFADLGASIIGLFATPLTFIIGKVQTALQGLADFVKGDVSPAMRVLRIAALGAAAGIGALLIAKAAAEALKLLGIATKFALTPMGALVGTFALVGAAIAVLYKQSSEFRELVEQLRVALGQSFARIMDRLADAVQRVAEAFEPVGDAISGATESLGGVAGPAQSLFDIIGNFLVGAINVLTNIIVQVLIPALESVAVFLVEHIVPAFEAVVSFITDIVIPAISNAASTIAGFISDVASTIQEFVSERGFLGAIADIGQAIAEALGQALGNLGEIFGNIFSGANLAKVASGALQVVETIGYVLGNIVSDPRFVKALAAIAAAAVVVAARFVEGFGRGVIENIPELADMIGDAFKAAIKLVFSDPKILLGAVGVAAFVAAFGRMIRTLFGATGKEAAKGFTSSFGSSMKTAFSRGAVSAFFGGEGGLSRQINRAFSKELTRGANERRRMWQQQNAFLQAATGQQATLAFPKLGIRESDLRAQIGLINTIKANLTEAQIAGLNARAAVLRTSEQMVAFADGARKMGSGLKTVGQAITSSLVQPLGHVGESVRTGLRDGLTQVRAGATQMGTVLRDEFARSAANMRAQGITLGQGIGGAVLAGFGAAMAGQAGGASGGGAGAALGIAGILASALGAAAVTGGNPFVGAAVGAIGTLSFVLSASGTAAKRAADEVDEYADALLTAKLAGEDLGETISGIVFENIKNELPSTRQAIAKLGIDLADLGTAALQGQVGLDRFAGSTLIPAIEDLIPTLGQANLSVRDFRRALLADSLTLTELGIDQVALQRDLDRVGLSLFDLREVFDALGDEGSEAFAGLSDSQADFIINQNMGTTATEELNARLAEGERLIRAIGATRENAARLHIESLEQAAVDAKTAFEQARDAFLRLFEAPPDTAAEAINASVIQVAGLGDTVEAALAEGGALGAAQLAQALTGPGGIQDAVLSAIGPGLGITIFTPDQAAAAIQPLIDAVNQSDISQAARDQILGAIGGTWLEPEFAARLEAAVATAQEQIETEAAANPLNIPLETQVLAGRLDLSQLNAGELVPEDAIRSALAGPVSTEDLRDLGRSLVGSVREGAGEAAGEVRSDGAEVGRGFGLGIIDSIPFVIAKARFLADATSSAIEDAFGIKSPSRVMMGIGELVAKGLAVGISEGSATAESAARKAVDDAINASISQLDKSRDAIAEASAALFEEFFKTPDAFVADDAFGKVTEAFQQVASTVDSSIRSAIDAAFTAVTERTRAQADIVGEDAFSLNVSDVLGVANRSSLISALGSIQDAFTSLLRQGTPISSAVTQVGVLVDQFTALATSLGFNADAVALLVDQLGLSDAALASFATEVADLSATASGGTGLPQPVVVQNNDINLALPYADPEAVALATANRLALQARY